MKITPKTRKFQEGGAAPQPEAQQQDPIMMLAQMAQQALQGQDCQAAMQVCQAFLQVVQEMQGAPQESGGEPVFRKGGVLIRRIKQ